MYYKCCVPGCNSIRKDFKLHKFPTDKVRLKLWVKFINFEILQRLKLEEFVKFQVCHRHFERRFVNSKTNLCYTAIPTLFSDEEIASGVPRVQVNFQYTPRKWDHTYARPTIEISYGQSEAECSDLLPSTSCLISFDGTYNRSLLSPEKTEDKKDNSQIKRNKFDHDYSKTTHATKYNQILVKNFVKQENKPIQPIKHDHIPEKIKPKPSYTSRVTTVRKKEIIKIPTPKSLVTIKKFTVPILEEYMEELDGIITPEPEEDFTDIPKGFLEEVHVEEDVGTYSRPDTPNLNYSDDDSAPEELSVQPPPPTHGGVICDNCKEEIKGFRYKCVTCLDYDLCMKCEMQEIHPEHLMLRISNQVKIKMADLFIDKWRRFFEEEPTVIQKKDNDNNCDSDTKNVKHSVHTDSLPEDIKDKIREVLNNKFEKNLHSTFRNEEIIVEKFLNDNKTDKPKHSNLGVSKSFTTVKSVKRKNIDYTNVDTNLDYITNPTKIARMDTITEFDQKDNVRRIGASSQLQQIQWSTYQQTPSSIQRAQQTPSSIQSVQQPSSTSPIIIQSRIKAKPIKCKKR